MLAAVATQAIYGEALTHLARNDERVVTIDADLMRSVGWEAFAHEFPDRAFQVGVAEQNMVGFATGLALSGKVPFTHTFAVFASRRVCDQLTISVAFNRANVKVVAGQAGLTAALNGATHQSLEDVAIVRAIPNMVIVEPCDALELRQIVPAIAAYEGPVYLRLPKVLPERLSEDPYQFTLGTVRSLRDGNDITFVTGGIMARYALEAAEVLNAEDISALVINASTLKPLDTEAIVAAARKTGAVVTVENHTINGGLGGAVAELLAETCPTPMVRLGTRDTFGSTGELPWLLQHHELGPSDIAAAARRVIAMKQR